MAMLAREGFERSGLIDIFDGGPTMTCQREQIRTIRETRSLRVEIGEQAGAEPRLLSTSEIEHFRCVRAPAKVRAETVAIELEAAEALGVRDGDMVRVSG